MAQVWLRSNPLLQEPQQIVLALVELRPARATPKKLVHQPHAIGRSDIALTIPGHLRDPTLPHVTLNL